jgi:hypothetical protein
MKRKEERRDERQLFLPCEEPGEDPTRRYFFFFFSFHFYLNLNLARMYGTKVQSVPF